MKIGIDVRCLMDSHYSGVPEYSYNLLKNLFKIDQENQYKLFYNSKQDIEKNLPQFEQDNVQYIGFKYPNKLFNFSLKFLNYPKIDQLIHDVDLFFMPNLNFMALTEKTKKIITVHDISFEIYPQYYTSKRKWWHKLITPNVILNDFQTIITDSINTKNNLIDYYNLDSNKIKVISLAIDQKLYKKIKKDDNNLTKIKVKYNLPADFLLYLGTIEPRKNISSIIESFNKIKKIAKYQELELVIAGAKGWKYDEVFKLYQDSPYKKQIHFIGYVDRKDKPYLFNLAKIFLFPSYYEGFGLPVLESQACGLPVICGLNSSLPEITNGSALLINPFDIKDLAKSIKLLLNNKKLKKNLINQGLENSKKFTWKKTAEQTLKIFQS